MKKSWLLVVSILALSAILLAACSGGGGGETITRQDPPADYAGKTNPVAGDQAAIDAGKALYETNCLSCHGEKGLGDGPAGASLDPHPGNLQAASKDASEAYLYWVVDAGGTAAGRSASMASYNGVLSEEEIWQILAYVKTLK
ncbi:MAG: cytochrome c [Anaerolineae bacterium]|nr:cytochrome c [Anaerolineae bacterium]